MMANQNTFMCECGNIIGRMESSVAWLRWNGEEGDPVMKGTSCATCKQNWLWLKPLDKTRYVNVMKCCKEFECRC